jgi:hypothetical protein
MPSPSLKKSAPKRPVDSEAPSAPETVSDEDTLNAEIAKDLEARIKANERQKKDLHAEWRSNVELRMGRMGMRTAALSTLEVNDDFQSDINPDWFLTKTKIANLYSQVPQVQVTHEATQYAPAIPPFAKQLNYELSEKRANVGVAMREVLADIVNAAGIGFVLVDYVARFEDKEVPSVDVSMIDPVMVEQAVAMKLIPTTTVSQVVSDKFAITRIAPMDGIWPADFAGSNFDDGDFVGYKGRGSASDIRHMFKLTDAQVERAKTAMATAKDDSLKVDDAAKNDLLSTQKLTYERLFYWRHRYDPDETSLTAIWEIVYVKGITKPVKHELWSGQRQDPKTGKYVGACRFPVRVGTITYISDNPIVPSDTSAGRPQVTDLRRSRSQMFLNRKRSTPLRWGNVNLIGPETQAQINDGTYQGFIWTNGTGERAIGEIARASYPSEDLSFDQAAMADLLQSWGLTPQSMGLSTPGRKNQMEVGAEVSGFSTNIGADRSLIQLFFLGIVEVLASLMALYSEFQILTPQEKQTMEKAWDRQSILTDMVLKIRPDSMIVLDPQQRIQRISGFMNLAVKSGYVAPKSLLIELAELSGIDPTEVIIDPTPPQPERPQLSYRFTGKEDMQNIAVVSMLAKNDALPSPENVVMAKKFLLDAQNPDPTPAEPAPTSAAGPAGGGVPPAPPPPGAEGAPPMPPHPADAETHTDWNLASKIAARSRDMTPGGE